MYFYIDNVYYKPDGVVTGLTGAIVNYDRIVKLFHVSIDIKPVVNKKYNSIISVDDQNYSISSEFSDQMYDSASNQYQDSDLVKITHLGTEVHTSTFDYTDFRMPSAVWMTIKELIVNWMSF